MFSELEKLSWSYEMSIATSRIGNLAHLLKLKRWALSLLIPWSTCKYISQGIKSAENHVLEVLLGVQMKENPNLVTLQRRACAIHKDWSISSFPEKSII